MATTLPPISGSQGRISTRSLRPSPDMSASCTETWELPCADSGRGRQGIFGNCFAPGAWYCQPVYGVDPKDYRKLIAADPVQKNHGQQRRCRPDLARNGGAAEPRDSRRDAFVHGRDRRVPGTRDRLRPWELEPRSRRHRPSGSHRSANGGLTWAALPGTASAPAISSIFFDDRTDVIYIATYGRGLWRLTVDWTTVQ
jgi:hypothetical protein